MSVVRMDERQRKKADRRRRRVGRLELVSEPERPPVLPPPVVTLQTILLEEPQDAA
jgi:hypothetical protein